MPPTLDRFFRAFEGTRSAYPVAIFRIAFFAGLALHFFPSLIWFDEGYRPGALRAEDWSEWLYEHFWRFPQRDLHVLAVLTIVACVMGIVGALPRVAAIVGGVGLYAFTSFNSIHLQTLALVEAWAILLLWMICGGGAATLSVEALLRTRKGAAPETREPSLLPGLVLYQVLLAVFFAGVEKVLAGWPWSNEMGIVLSYPRGFLVRDWVAGSSFMHGWLMTHFATCFTLVAELGTPIALLFKRTRLVALVVYQAFFIGIIAMLEVPPLFYCTFAFGGLLALDDEEVDRLCARLRRRS
ncbi:MAG TPA: hypothetical protein VF765_32545 [Polyangiaceae bacterium]